jgi:hypothetical protein
MKIRMNEQLGGLTDRVPMEFCDFMMGSHYRAIEYRYRYFEIRSASKGRT